MKDTIAVIGLGYVGLPVALAFAKEFPGTLGFDVNTKRINELSQGIDRTGETSRDELLQSSIQWSCNKEDLKKATFFVVAVPTPVEQSKQPDLGPLARASETVGKVLQKGSVVVYESTVYPGVTEEICGPILEKHSGLKQGIDFKLGYSPERINPGDKEHTLTKITKVVSGEDPETLERVARTYGAIIKAGIHKAPSIKVAEAAKVIENTQRDLNIALMNELSKIFDLMGIRTRDVLEAAGTKWNFLKFSPGLVGGHCIGVDPYYLTTKAEQLGYHPEVILAGRKINDGLGKFIAEKMVKLLIRADGISVCRAKIGILGLTFKENVSDLRNSRVPDIIHELQEYGITPLVHDCFATAEEAHREYGVTLASLDDFNNLDGLILAVPHQPYLEMGMDSLSQKLSSSGVLIDVKSVLTPNQIKKGIHYFSL